MERTIKVTGTGRISVKPDQTIINLDFRKVLPTYDEALKASATDVGIIKNALVECGIDKDTLKTTRFDVDTHFHSYRDKDGNYQSEFDGYEYQQSLRFTFDVDNKLLGRVLYQLSKLPVMPEFRIHYGVKDSESAKNELLGNAIKDAKKKAEIISIAAGVQLDEIVDINYSWLDIEFNTRSYGAYEDRLLCSKSKSASGFDIDIEPEDIERSDNVTLVFKIK